MIITLPPMTLQTDDQPASYILHERATQFYGAGVAYLSIKSFFGGQPYDITVESAAPVESFCVFFAPGFAESVRRGLATPTDRLLLDPDGAGAADLTFLKKRIRTTICCRRHCCRCGAHCWPA